MSEPQLFQFLPQHLPNLAIVVNDNYVSGGNSFALMHLRAACGIEEFTRAKCPGRPCRHAAGETGHGRGRHLEKNVLEESSELLLYDSISVSVERRRDNELVSGKCRFVTEGP